METMERLANIHPGEILEEEFLKPLGITPYRLAKATGIQQTRVSEIIKGTRGVSADTAIRLGRFFHTTPQFWLNLQAMYELEAEQSQESKRAVYAAIHAYDEDASMTISR